MVDSERLLNRIKEKGLKQAELARELGIRQSTLSLKINNKRPFFVTEALQLAALLEIKDEEFGGYFFAAEVA